MSDILLFLLDVVNITVFFYFVVLNGIYLLVTLLAFKAMQRHARRSRIHAPEHPVWADAAPPVTILIPLYNESATAVDTIRGLLSQQHPNFEIIAVDDGSEDDTVDRLVEDFDLRHAARVATAPSIETAPVRRILNSRAHPRLWLITKENGGKADTLNAGLIYCQTPLFCAIDGDTLVERDALLRMSRPFLENRHTIGSGGVLRAINGSVVERGIVREVRAPTSWLARFQVVEYIRAFLAGRTGWNSLGILLVISGAFGIFRRESVVAAGGYDPDAIGEDMELVIRLHLKYREEKRPYRMDFVPDPVAWTQVPESVGVLTDQRDRWQRGLMQSLRKHRRAFLRPRYGRIGLLAFPYYGILERYGPLVEVGGYGAFIIAASLGRVSWPFALAFLGAAIGLGMVLSLSALLIEELMYRRYTRWRDLGALMAAALLENLGNRQMHAVMRVRGMISEWRGNTSWGARESRKYDAA